MAQPAPLVHRDWKGRKANKAQRVREVLRARMAKMAHLVREVSKGRRVSKARQAPMGGRARVDRKETPDRLEVPDPRDLKVHLGQKVNAVKQAHKDLPAQTYRYQHLRATERDETMGRRRPK